MSLYKIVGISLASIVIFSLIYVLFVILTENINVSEIRDANSFGSALFNELDTNNDGSLTLSEFLNFRKHCSILSCEALKESDAFDYEVQEFPYLPIKLGEQVITIDVNFKPLVVSSLMKDVTAMKQEELGSLNGLLNWTIPFKLQHPLGAKSFSVFLPSGDMEPGLVWWIVKSKIDSNMGQMSSKRYFPPLVEPEFHLLFSLLSLFHPHPFLWTRFSPQGTAAVLRAVGANVYDIVFRMHAEFQLNKPPLHPFWFTPSQFQGRLIINKDSTVVKFFHMEVPDRKLNIDMEWLNGLDEASMEVDIGYVPEMSLTSSAISVPSASEMGIDETTSAIKWEKEITLEEAHDLLDQAFFPFKKVKYYTMPEAFEQAQAESKLVHGIILWGNLDDQSC